MMCSANGCFRFVKLSRVTLRRGGEVVVCSDHLAVLQLADEVVEAASPFAPAAPPPTRRTKMAEAVQAGIATARANGVRVGRPPNSSRLPAEPSVVTVGGTTNELEQGVTGGRAADPSPEVPPRTERDAADRKGVQTQAPGSTTAGDKGTRESQGPVTPPQGEVGDATRHSLPIPPSSPPETNMKDCKWPDCNRQAQAKGFCTRDYMRGKSLGLDFDALTDDKLPELPALWDQHKARAAEKRLADAKAACDAAPVAPVDVAPEAGATVTLPSVATPAAPVRPSIVGEGLERDDLTLDTLIEALPVELAAKDRASLDVADAQTAAYVGEVHNFLDEALIPRTHGGKPCTLLERVQWWRNREVFDARALDADEAVAENVLAHSALTNAGIAEDHDDTGNPDNDRAPLSARIGWLVTARDEANAEVAAFKEELRKAGSSDYGPAGIAVLARAAETAPHLTVDELHRRWQALQDYEHAPAELAPGTRVLVMNGPHKGTEFIGSDELLEAINAVLRRRRAALLDAALYGRPVPAVIAVVRPHQHLPASADASEPS